MNFIFDQSLVLYLPLYELYGSSFMSRDAYGHLCMVTGAVWRPDGRYFDGLDDWISMPYSPVLDLTDRLTIEVWGNQQIQNAGSRGGWFAKSVGEAVNTQFHLACDPDYNAEFRVVKSSTLYTATSDAALTLNEFVHLVGRYDGSEVSLWINGAKQADTEAVAAPLDGGNGTSRVGQIFHTAYDLGGIIGELRLYSRALTPLEIQRNYLATKWRYR